MQKNYDVQITKLTKIIKEKEVQYIKQKETMTSYYEQILNDVNSRVKVNIFLKVFSFQTYLCVFQSFQIKKILNFNLLNLFQPSALY